MKKIDRLGQRFDKLLVVAPAPSEIRKDGNGSFTRWKCICDCGKEVVMRTNNLMYKKVKSCGCYRTPKHPKGYAGFLRVYRAYKTNSGKRDYLFMLTEGDFMTLTTKNCHYCGTTPQTLASTGASLAPPIPAAVPNTNAPQQSPT